MRNIPLFTGLIILSIYMLFSVVSWQTIKTALNQNGKSKRLILYGYFCYMILQSLIFFILFIFPFTTSSTTRYNLYFIYNSILIADLFTKVPLFLAGILLLFFTKRSLIHNALSIGGTLFATGILSLFIWGFTIGSRTLRVEKLEFTYADLPIGLDGFRISQISDLHLGNFHYKKMLRRAIDENNRYNPDVLMFTGDLVNNFAYETPEWTNEILRFRAGNKLAILGNHDYGDYFRWPDREQKRSNFEGIKDSFHTLGFQLLANQSALIVKGNDTLYFVGVENWGHPPFPQYADLDIALENIPAEAFKVVMSHDPAHWETIISNRENFPLTFSGHSHGMQWGIKLAGFEFSPIYFSRKLWGGKYDNDGKILYVNRGLGTIGIPLRIDMPAEITFVTLRKK